MRIYITQSENANEGQKIINLDSWLYKTEHKKEIVDPEELIGAKIIDCEKDSVGDIVITISAINY